jgi:prepilin-type N-terminal cleavage/methylation domain-containing protein
MISATRARRENGNKLKMKAFSTTAPSRSASGFTLIEMLVVLTVVGILTVIALPNFKSLSQSQRVKNASYELYSGISLTRSEAIKRNNDATLAIVTNAKSEPGWTISAMSASGVVPIHTQVYISGVAMTVTGLASPVQVVYKRSGRTNSAAKFQIDAAGVTTPTPFVRCVTIELSGMPRIRQGICS